MAETDAQREIALLRLVGASDLGWLRELLAERIAVETLSSQGPSTRAELTAAWQAGGIDTSSQRGYHLIWHLAHTGTVFFGPVRNGQQLLALAGQQTRAPASLTRDEALKTHRGHRIPPRAGHPGRARQLP
jgi:hypothetical protein